MTVLLGALVLAGRVLLILVLVLLVLAGVLLLIPVGLAIRWTPESGVLVKAYAGPLQRLLFPWHQHQPPQTQKTEKKPAPPDKKPPEPAQKTAAVPEPASPAKAVRTAEPDYAVKTAPATPADPGREMPGAEPESEPPLPPVGPEPEDLTPGEQDALLQAARIFFGTLAPYRKRLLQGVQVNRLQIFWTVTGEDAADTAVSYGRHMAVSNALLTLARQFVTIRAESLRMEPDFTGTLAEKRIFSCQIRTRPYIILMILFYLMRREKQGRSPLEQIQDKLGALE